MECQRLQREAIAMSQGLPAIGGGSQQDCYKRIGHEQRQEERRDRNDDDELDDL